MSTRITGIGSLGACHALIRAFRASATGCLLSTVLLAALPLQVMAQTQGVSVSANPAAFGQYVSIMEGDDVTFTVSRTGDNSDALTVNYAIIPGGGPADLLAEQAGEGDYTSIPTSYEFPAGSSASHEFTVTAVDDEVYEPRQYFTLTASGSYRDQSSTISFSKQLTVRITENDDRYLTLSPVSPSALVDHPEFMAKEGGISNGKNELTISLNAPLPYVLQIPYTVGDDPHTTASANDFTMAGGTLTIPEGQTFVTIDVKINDDLLVEPTEYFTLDFGTTDYDDPGDAKGTFNSVDFQDSRISGTTPLSVSIMDNDTANMGGVVYLRGEGGGGIAGFPSTRTSLTEGQKVTITAEIAGAVPTGDIEIPLKFAHFPSGEATEDDYTISEQTITISGGKKSGSVELEITDDKDDERYRELLVVEIDDAKNFPTGYLKGDRSKYEVIMLDNDKTPASLTGPSITALTEDGTGTTMATFELRIDRRPKANPSGTPPFTGKGAETDEGDATLVLGYTGTATRGRNADYTSTTSAFEIPKSPASLPTGCSSQGEAVKCMVTLTVRDDNLYEGGAGKTEDVKIDLTGQSSFNDGIIKPAGHSLTIEDNDLQPMLSVGDVTAIEGDKLAFEVTRTGAMENRLSVQAATAKDSREGEKPATASSDYATRSEMLEFEKNKLNQTFEVTTTPDVIDEPDETFLVKLSMARDTGGEPKPGIADDTAVGTITDNDDAPARLTIAVDTDTGTDGKQNTIAEAAGMTTVSVTATIDSPTRFAADQTVTVTVGKQGDGAVEGTDYAEVAHTIEITIPATQASGTDEFKLTPDNDRIDEDGEKISVEGELTGTTVTPAAITIVDDDTRGITVDPATLTIDEVDNESTEVREHEGTYEVALTSQPEGGTVTVEIESEGPKVATVHPSSLTFDAANWEMAQTVTVTAKNDTIDDTGDQKTTTITHTVSAASTDYADEEVKDVAVTVLDDDGAPTALKITVDTDTGTDGDQGEISEGAATPTVRITATLDGDTQFAADKTITITVGDSDNDTATEGGGGDYATVNEFDITLPAGAESISHNLTLTLNDDAVDEPDETVTVTGALAGVTVTGTMLTIEDNDDTPTVTLVLTPASINESGATNSSTVTATMDGTSSEAVTLTVSATPVSPAVAADLALSENTTLTIPANTQASTGVVTITAVDNKVDAADKTVTVAATATGGNALVQAPGGQTLTITDDDTRGITVSKATLTLDEEDNAATMEADEHQDIYTVVLDSEPSGGAVTIGVASGDTTIAGVAPATLTFTASNWDMPQTVTVTAVADGIDNPNDRRTAAVTHTVTATGTDYDGATASGVTVTVNDDDGAPTLSINSPSVTEVDSGATSTLTFTVRLTPASGNTVTVDYADTGDGTATSGGTDYETLASGTLTFAASETSKSVAVTVNSDDIDEPDETVVVRLSSPSNATLTGGATTLDGTGTINDNDPAPTVSVADATAVSEGNVAAPDPSNNMTFTVTLSAASGQKVTVPYTLGGTATAGTDYTEPDPRSVTIAAGTTQANIDIAVAGDEVDEENETITVTLGTPTDATVSTEEGAGAASGTITDDDTRGVSVTPTALTVAEADNTGTAATREDQGTYKVVLTSQPTGAVTVNLNSGDESVARIDTASLVFDADDWNTERMVTVTGQADVIDNTGDEREVDISHTVSADGTDYADETAEDVTVTVTDDDDAPSGITLTASPDSVTENGGAKTITVTAAVNGATRYAEAKTVSVSAGGGTAISVTDYMAVDSFDITIGAGEDDATNTFTLTPTNDVLAEGNETIDVTGTLSGITITPDEIMLTDDDDAPSGITLSVDTNGATAGTPSNVAEDAGATVVTVTATVNGTTRYVEAKTVAVSVADNTAASPADYAAVSGFNITIAAGAASQAGTFELTPVDDDLDEPGETIDVAGTLTDITITGATVTLTDTDDPVSFSIADAEATEGGKVTFTVSREGAEDNVVSVKVATATDSGDGVKAADADDYTAIATAQTLDFAKGITSQTVEVQTTQDDLFEPDETFKANLSAPALGDGDPGTGVSIAAGKGTATGTIKNDDTEPSFAVADASASEGSAITFTVTRSGAMDNVVSVKWNTKAATGAGAAATTDYTAVTAPATLSFAKGVSSRTFTVSTTEDNLHEGDETFLVELTGAVGGTIATAEATGTITDDDAAPTGITLSVDADTGTNNVQSSIAEEGGVKTVRVTATIDGTTRFATAQTVTVTVGKDGDSATEGTDYSTVDEQSIEIPIGDASAYVDFMLTPTTDVLFEGSETISVDGTLTDVTFTNSSITITDDDAAPTTLTLAVDADNNAENVQSSLAENGGAKTVKVTATLGGATQFDVDKTLTLIVGDDDDSATEGTDYTDVADITLTILAGEQDVEHTFTLTPTDDAFNEGSETISFDATLASVTVNGASITLTSDDAAPAITLTVDADKDTDNVQTSLAEDGGVKTVRVTATLDGTTRLEEAADLTLAVGKDGDSAVEGTDYTTVDEQTITIGAGVASVIHDFTLTPTNDDLYEGSETISLDGTLTGVAVTDTSLTITDDDAAPTGITLSVDTNGSTSGTPSTVAEDAGATVVTVTATVNGATRYVDAKTVAVSVDDDTAASPADYAAVNNFNITIAAGAASQAGTFELTPVDDDLDEPGETIDVAGTLTDITITGATVTLTDTDDPVSFSIAGAEATEGGKVTFTVSRAGAGDNVASVKVTTATDSGDGVKAADADDYTAIATAQTLNFAKGVTSQTVEVQTTQDDLFEPDETFRAVLSAPALADGDPGTGVSIESGKGTAIGTIKNDDTEPSFAVADASASEGDAITFTVTRSGAQDNAVSVKWNTKADSSDGANAASATDYTRVTTAQTLTFAKGVGTQTFAVATTEDTLHEGAETFLVELTGAVGGTIATAEATGTITDDDAAPTGITLSVDADTGTDNAQTSLAEDGGVKTVRVTATLAGSSTFTEAKTVTVEVGADADGAEEGTDYAEVPSRSITIDAGSLSGYVEFTLTPTDDDIDEPSEGISIEGTLTGITVTGTAITLTDDETTPTVTLVLTPSTINESGNGNASTVTATLSGKSSVAVTLTVAAAAGADTVASDFTVTTNKTLTIAAGATTSTGTVTITAVDNDIDAPNKSVTVSATASGGGVGNPDSQTLTINDDEGVPTVTLVLTPTTIDESGDDNESTVTATLSGKSNVDVILTVAAAAGADTAPGDFTLSTTTTLTITAGATTSTGTVTITAVDNDVDAPNKSVTVSATASGGGVGNPTDQTLTITDDEGTPTVTLVLTPTAIDESGDDNASTVTATLSGKSSAAVTVTVSVPNAAPVTLSATTTLTIAAEATTSTGTVTITAVDNDVDAPNATVTVSGVAAGGGVSNPDNQTLTITDDDDAPSGITLSVDADTGTDNAQTSLAEDGGVKTVRVTAMLGGSSTFTEAKTVTVEVGADADGAEEGIDYTTVTSKSITIDAGCLERLCGLQPLTPDRRRGYRRAE